MQWTFGILCLGCLCQVFVFDRLANLIGLCMAYQISSLLMIVRDLTQSLCNLVPLYSSTLYSVLLCLCKFLSWEICTSCFDLKSQIPAISNWKVSFLGNCLSAFMAQILLYLEQKQVNLGFERLDQSTVAHGQLLGLDIYKVLFECTHCLPLTAV